MFINFSQKIFNKSIKQAGAHEVNFIGRMQSANVDTFELQNKPFVEAIRSDENVLKYPKDVAYKKAILHSLGMDDADISLLTPIAGKQEYDSIVRQLNDCHDAYLPNGTHNNSISIPIIELKNVQNKKFRINSHMHTIYSDGKLSIEELLKQADDYADLLHKDNSRSFPNIPFVICITDHNTAESSKKITEHVLKNPDKYKNLRIVLGSEISTKEKSLGGQKLKIPIYPHIVTQFINPYSRTVAEYFNLVIQDGRDCCHAKAFPISELVEKLKDEDCLYTLAHPLRTPNLEPTIENMRSLMDLFKNSTQDKGFACEAYYGNYDDDLIAKEDCLNFIKNYVSKIGLNKVGGLDTHGTSIFYK